MNKKILLLTLLFLSHTALFAQNISTFAGSAPGYSGDGGAATSAKMQKPNDITFDNAGNAYISDRANNCIRKVSGGIITTIAGTGTAGYSGDGGAATNATMKWPAEIVIDISGNIYFGEAGNHVVRKISTSGIISTVAGTGTAGFSGDGLAATLARLNTPLGVEVDAAGNVYIADQQNQRVRKVSTSGAISTISGTGTFGYSGDGIAASTSKLNYPQYLHINPSGELLISDNGNHRIRKISSAGIISTIIGNGVGGFVADGVPATSTPISFPGSVQTDASGNTYVCENGGGRVRKMDASGIIHAFAGTGTHGFSGDGAAATAAKINSPIGMGIDGSQRIYVADCDNDRIRVVGTNSKPSFTHTSPTAIIACQGSIRSVDTTLDVTDGDTGDALTWSLLTVPTHGSVIGSYTATSTGGNVIPSGLSYTPAIGYSGSDMFEIKVTDGIDADTMTIDVTVMSLPNAGIISGVDSVCPGFSVTLSETVGGGIWSSSDYSIARIKHTAVVEGVAPGKDTVIYTVINACGISSAIFPFTVRSYTACHTGISSVSEESNRINIYPNPNSGNFTINIPSEDNSPVKISIINMLGSHIKEATIPSNTTNDISLSLPAGVYLLHATTAHQQWSERFIIK